jgi:hypothetical protein
MRSLKYGRRATGVSVRCLFPPRRSDSSTALGLVYWRRCIGSLPLRRREQKRCERQRARLVLVPSGRELSAGLDARLSKEQRAFRPASRVGAARIRPKRASSERRLRRPLGRAKRARSSIAGPGSTEREQVKRDEREDDLKRDRAGVREDCRSRRSRGRALRRCDAAAACASPSRSARPYAEVSSVGAGGAEASIAQAG